MPLTDPTCDFPRHKVGPSTDKPEKTPCAGSAYDRMFHVEHISYLANSRTSNQQVLPRKRRDAMCSTRNSPDVYRHSFKQRPNILTPIPGWGERQTFAHRQTKSTSRYRDQSPTEDLPICKEGYRRKLAPPGRSPHPPEKIDARFRPSANSEPCSAQDRSLRSTWNIKVTNFEIRSPQTFSSGCSMWNTSSKRTPLVEMALEISSNCL